jgi:glycosyltransferase involved in cell wall biosynthesis
MRALPAVMKQRPEAQVVIVGGDEVSYGSAPKEAKGWKDTFLNEVKDQLDLSRVHFMGKVPYPTFVSLMQVSRAHAYLTYPFVLSWSMLESMAAGAHVVGSDTAPVRELIRDGENGTLVDFFDVKGWSKALTKALARPEAFLDLRRAARQTILEGYDLRSVCLPAMVEYVEGFGPK